MAKSEEEVEEVGGEEESQCMRIWSPSCQVCCTMEAFPVDNSQKRLLLYHACENAVMQLKNFIFVTICQT